MVKSDRVTVSSRVEDTLRLLLDGSDFEAIRQYASAQRWSVSDRQLRRYIESAHKEVVNATQQAREQLVGRHLLLRRELYAMAVRAGDLRTALAVLRDEARLCQIYDDVRFSPNAEEAGPVNFKEVNELRRQMLHEPAYLDYCRSVTAPKPSG